MSGFKDKCAPFVYIAECPPKERDALMVASRVWLVLNSIALLALVVTFIRRLYLVKEKFNTLRLVMIKFMLGIPLHIAYDATRAFSANAFGAPVPLTSFLQTIGWVPVITGMILITITWMTFSSKNLLARPAVTGNWLLYLSIIIPYVITSILATTIAGINYRCYFIAFRVVLASWSAMFLLLFLCCIWYGRKTLNQLKTTPDKFAKAQIIRAFVLVSAIFISAGIVLGINAFLMDSIDRSTAWFLIITTFYRTCALSLFIGGSIYVWLSTSRWVSHPPKAGSRTGSSSQNGLATTDTPKSPRFRSTPSTPESDLSSSSSSSSLLPSASEDSNDDSVDSKSDSMILPSSQLEKVPDEESSKSSSSTSSEESECSESDDFSSDIKRSTSEVV